MSRKKWLYKITNYGLAKYNRSKGKQFCHFDIIKVKVEKIADLILKRSLLCKLLALKADDRDTEIEPLRQMMKKLTA